MKLSVLAPTALAALLLAASAAWAEEAASPEPEILPDEYFHWGSSSSFTFSRLVGTASLPPYFKGFEMNFWCSTLPRRDGVRTVVVDFDFGMYERLRGKGRTAAVRVGFWSRLKPAGGDGYILRHDVEVYEAAKRAGHENASQVAGAKAKDLIRKIYRADSFNWTEVATGRASRPHPVTDKARALLERAMDYCGISHEPAP